MVDLTSSVLAAEENHRVFCEVLRLTVSCREGSLTLVGPDVAVSTEPQRVELVGDARALVKALDTLVYAPPGDFNLLRGTEDVCVSAGEDTVLIPSAADPLASAPRATCSSSRE